jgi:hypothetical protein
MSRARRISCICGIKRPSNDEPKLESHEVTMPRSVIVSILLISTLGAACTNRDLPTASPISSQGIQQSAVPQDPDPAVQLQQIMTAANGKLSAVHSSLRISKIDWISRETGRGAATIYDQQVGDKRWDGDFIRGDVRRWPWSYPVADPNALVYSIDVSADGAPPYGGLSVQQASDAIERAMRTWDAPTCTTLELKRETLVTPEIDLGFAAWLATNGQYGSEWLTGDIVHAGFGSLVVPGALAFTTEFIFWNNGVPTDLDHNHKYDVAFREIYYAPGIPWVDDPDSDPRVSVDLESLALHEAGHGLSQWHFGTLLVHADGTPSYSPTAVMNALYLKPLRTLQGSDIGGHCGIWAQW